ncbi:LuxR C-terminal-related transcriptional regulator [Micropruina sp.]|uniref:LuxR C-terminal-related transcriptional regulator n=1 Tax=Micropruina sp. TaxID=2737536 RepID=UPI0039E3D58D
MVDTCLIDRREAQVMPEDTRVRAADPAEVLLEMLCDAMRVLNTGGSADQVVCRHLARGLRASTAVTFALAPDSQIRMTCVQPELQSAQILAEALLRRLNADGPDLRTEYTEDFGHIASLWIRPADTGNADEVGHGRVLVYVRSEPFDSDDRRLLERAREALLALWPLGVRTVRAQHAREWVQATVAEGHMTDRELQVLGLLAEGLLATSIAARLQLSPRTVHKHLGNIYRKLGVHDRLVAVSLARLHGLVQTYPSSPSSPEIGN